MDANADMAPSKFGADVRRLREQAGISQNTLAARVPVSQSTISDLERGRIRVKKDIASRIDQLLIGDGRLVAAWEAQYETYAPPEWYRKLPMVEREATEIQEYQPLLVPGLLQTREYATAAIRAGQRLATDDEVGLKVEERLERQSILQADSPPLFLAVVDETALRRRLGSAGVMVGQLDRLLEASCHSRVELLVIPGSTQDHPGLDGGFKLLRVPKTGTVVYYEARAGGGVVMDPEIIDQHVSLMGVLRGVALPPEQSRELISRIQGENQ
ncbi:helix-turn-helix transcriptional regulator [Spiractinospora alimapuensis]|uniref:helix-turn-helix domain-containing protein n=1 Tax=Spiractinospora alimapuensis TaxID=2820884 RepID=UPI001F404EE1|nr:helix-turn-helix transcriptional regulator [Spiractinospora alimapuensis]QVQ52934.1 helix-turn-helix transcriptional regulator [Spiractinospora alimapuensis]